MALSTAGDCLLQWPQHSWGLQTLLCAMPVMVAAFWPVSCLVTNLLSKPQAALLAEALPRGMPQQG